jgi:ADP-ribose pyrophosphatase YjhB (NUDIX family)
VRREYPTRPIASAAAVVLDGGRVLLVRRGRAPRKDIWTFQGGAIELGETAREACAREVFEETGLTVRVGPPVEVVDIKEADGNRWRYHYTIVDLLAEVAPDSGPIEAATDAAEAVWAPLGALDPYHLDPVTLRVLEQAVEIKEMLSAK